jgi:parallel beta-helix repeat protein
MSKALEDARSGDRIELLPTDVEDIEGHDALMIRKSVEIVGSLENIVTVRFPMQVEHPPASEGDVFVRISGLVVEIPIIDEEDESVNCNQSVVVENGASLLLEECTVRRGSVRVEQGKLFAFYNDVGHARHSAIAGFGDSQVYARGNILHHCILSGMDSQSRSNIHLIGNTVHSNHAHGFFGTKQSTGFARGNRLSKNHCVGIHLAGKSQFDLSSNTISHNRQSGICVQEDARAGICNNDIFKNSYGIDLTDNCHVDEICSNTCHDNLKGGLHATEQTTVVLCKRNKCYNNKVGRRECMSSVMARPTPFVASALGPLPPTVSPNSSDFVCSLPLSSSALPLSSSALPLSSSALLQHSGIVIRGKGGCIWDNVCYANGYNGIGIEGVRASANVYHNQTYSNKMLGIFIAGMHVRVSVTANHCYKNKVSPG